jgi:hypothetical protein
VLAEGGAVGIEALTPRAFLERKGDSFERYDKSRDFLGLGPGQQERNHALSNRVRALPPDEKTSYIARNGLNRVRSDRTVRLTQDRIRWIKYRTEDVLEPMMLQSGIVTEPHYPDPQEPVKGTRAASATSPPRADPGRP